MQASDAVSPLYFIRLLTGSSERKCALKTRTLASLHKMYSRLGEGGPLVEVQGVSPVGF